MRVHRATGSAAINSTLDVGTQLKGWQLEAVKLHLSAAGAAGNFTVTIDAAGGSAYDTVIFTQDMTTTTDLLWIPDLPIPLADGDDLVFAFANGSGRTYGLEATWNPRS